MGKSVLISSGKGGVGKSSLVVNCGSSLVARGKKVLLIDADAGMRALDLMLSVSGSVVYDLGDVLSGRCEPVKAIVEDHDTGLHLLPAPQAITPELFDAQAMKLLCKGLTHYYDFLLIDSPAGIGPGALTAAAGAQSALVVATADPVSIRDAERMAVVLAACGVEERRLVINRVVPKLIQKGIAANLDEVINGVGLRLIGVVPEDENVTLSVYAGKPLRADKKGAAQAYSNIAARLDGEELPLMKLK